jgi:hypothetical protein
METLGIGSCLFRDPVTRNQDPAGVAFRVSFVTPSVLDTAGQDRFLIAGTGFRVPLCPGW